MLRIARSDLDPKVKARVLPARTPAGMRILGSKTGLAIAVADLDAPQPDFAIVDEPAQLDAAMTHMQRQGPLLVKGERGGGGERLLAYSEDDPVRSQPPHNWYPLLVQQRIEGTEIGVDALFGDDRLLAWTYSEPDVHESLFGRSLERRFVDPPTSDFVETLHHLAHSLGLRGFANCTFIRRRTDGRHLLVELDMRPNAWHQFGPALGVDWSAALASPPPRPLRPALPPLGRRVRLYPRQLVHAIAKRSFASARPWILREPGTWTTRNHLDRAVNSAERADVLREIGRLPQRAFAIRRSRNG